MFIFSLEIYYSGDKTMNFYYIAQALNALVPDCAFGCGDTYDSIEWYSTNTKTLPTEDEINTKIAELKAAEPMRLLRIHRDVLLKETDWSQGKDVPVGIQSSYVNYRQQLRDLPSTATPVLDSSTAVGITSVTWPTKPS